MIERVVRDRWTYVKVTGGLGLDELLGAIQRAPNVEGTNVLIDVSRLANVSDAVAHALLGEQMASSLAKAGRIALLVHEDCITYNAERAARVRVNLRTFTAMAEAESWLSA